MAISPIAGSTPVFPPLPKNPSGGCSDRDNCDTTQTADSKSADPRQKLSEEEQQKVKELAARDREVRAHEAAHKAAGAGLTGPASYSFTTGPDGKRYAIGGEVSVDTSEVPGDPQATLLKANRIRAAALAPAEPSGQDLQVAAQAAQLAAAARQELAKHSCSNDAEKSNTSAKRDDLYRQTASVTQVSNKGSQVDCTA